MNQMLQQRISALMGSDMPMQFQEGGEVDTPEMVTPEMRMMEGYDKIMLQVLNSLFLVGAWVITYFVIKLLLKLNQNRIERLELNTTLKQAQLNTLKGQINPHFMFNSLNNIRGLMLEDVDSQIFGEPKKQILRLDILKEYLNYLKKLDDPNIRLNQVLKHIYGLNKGLKNARKYRYEINQIIKEGNLSGSFERLSSYLF